MILNLTIGNQTINYELVRKNVKNINIRIRPDKSIYVSANKRVSVKDVEALLLEKSDWIMKVLAHYDQRDTKKEEEFLLKDGAKIRLLDKEYQIRVLQDFSNKIEMDLQIITIFVKDLSNIKKIETMWEKWYASYIRETIGAAVERIYPLFKPYGVVMPKVKYRTMKTRWGSCAVHGGSITLNTRLIHFPVECIEYVVAHELAHFIHPNHSKKFYEFLSEVMPDHKVRRELMKRA
ncbi:MAG: M48 family metallopeptidase [Clostridiales bacterium]|nr:M48 family metallopeptidase [Clostridiales bacterium]